MIYADNAATSGHKPDRVIEAVKNALESPGNPGRGAHEASLSASRTVLRARETVSSFFDMENANQVVFTSGITESLNTVIKGLLCPGDHVITTWAEHNSVLRPLYEMEDKGIALTITDPSPSSIQKAVRENTKAIIMTHGSNVTGEVYDIRAVGKIAKEHDILFVVDTAQTAGVLPISMKKDHVDILCFTGHKGLLGPQGTGGMIIREEIKIRPLKSGGSGIFSFEKRQPDKMPVLLEAGTLNTPGIAGLAEGILYIKEKGIENIYAQEMELTKMFYDGIKQLPGVILYGSQWETGAKASSIVAVNVTGYDSGQVSDELFERFGIATRAGAHCAPLMHKHLGTQTQGIVRFSFGEQTSKEEIQYMIKAMETLTTEE